MQKSTKGQVSANHLVENPIDGYPPLTDLLLDESVLSNEQKKSILVGVCILMEW